jgi:hypothetical protein
LTGEQILEWEVDIRHQVTKSSLNFFFLGNSFCIYVVHDVDTEPLDEDQTTHEQKGVCEVEDDWEFIKSAKPLGKDEGHTMLEEEGKVQEAKDLDGVESLVEVVSSWSNYLVDVLNLGQTCDNFTLII